LTFWDSPRSKNTKDFRIAFLNGKTVARFQGSIFVRLGILAILVALLLVSTFAGLSALHILFLEDQALSFAVGDRLAHGTAVFLGPPSHIGGRHFGPWLYYLIGGALKITSGDTLWTLRICSLFNVVALLLVALIGARLSELPERFWTLVAILTAVSIGNYLDLTRSFWHSNLLVLPTLFTFVAGYFLLAHGAGFLPLYLLCASITFQLHFSTFPLVAAFPLFWVLSRGKKLRPQGTAALLESRRAQIIFLVLAALSWLPALLFELYYGGNFSTVLQALQVPHPHAGLRVAARAIASFFARFFAGGVLVDGVRITLLLPALVTLGAGLLLVDVFLRATREVKRFAWAVVLTLVLYFVVMSRQEAPLYDYYLYGLLPVPAILCGLILARAVALVADARAGKILKGVSAVFLAGMVCCYGAFVSNPGALPYRRSLHRVYTLGFAREVAGAIVADAAREPVLHDYYLIGYNALKVTRDSIYYFMGDPFYRFMHYAERFPELGNIPKPGLSAYLVVCPKLEGKGMRRIAEKLKPDWEFSTVVSNPSCSSCRICFIRRLRRKEQM
jgi:hypothetical protein